MTATLNCKFGEEGSQLPSSLNQPATVGAELMLSCEGTPPQFDAAKLKVDALNQPEHTAKLLKFEPKGETTFITFTSYRVGEHADVELLLTDGKEVAKTNPLTFTVQSVIDPQNPEAGQPFGPFGPWEISWPWWYFLIAVILLLAAIFSSIRAWRASKRKLEVRRKIKEYREKFIPFDQYQKALRKLDREFQQSLMKSTPIDHLFEELRQVSQTYLMMEFELDLEKRSPRWIVRKLKRKSTKAKDATLNDLALFLNEFQKKESAAEIEKLIDWAGRISEKVDRESFGVKT